MLKSQVFCIVLQGVINQQVFWSGVSTIYALTTHKQTGNDGDLWGPMGAL